MAGVKVTIRPDALSTVTDAAVTAVDAGAGPLSVNVADVTVCGSMRLPDGTEKVALIVESGQALLLPLTGLVDATEMAAGAIGPVVVKLQM